MLKRSVVFVAVIGIASLVAAANGATVSRVFRLEHVSMSEASVVVQPMLSDVGTLTLQPGLSRMTVQDIPDVIARVAKMIAELDSVPGMYRVQVDLLEGGAEKPYGLVQEFFGDDRLRKMFKAAAFYRLGSSTIEGELGSQTQAELGTSFQVSFIAQLPDHSRETPWGAPDLGDRIQLRQLVLERRVVASDGTLNTDELLRTNVLLSPEQTVYIGAGNSEDSENVLVLIVHAHEFGSR